MPSIVADPFRSIRSRVTLAPSMRHQSTPSLRDSVPDVREALQVEQDSATDSESVRGCAGDLLIGMVAGVEECSGFSGPLGVDRLSRTEVPVIAHFVEDLGMSTRYCPCRVLEWEYVDGAGVAEQR